jgi:hypothetical protein
LFKSNNRLSLKVICIYVVTAFLADTISAWYQASNGILLFYTYSIFTICEYTFFAWYTFALMTRRVLKKTIVVLSAFFYLVSFYFFYTDDSYSFDSNAASILLLLSITYCFFILYELLNDRNILVIYQTSHFWIAIGIMIYCAGNFFLFLYVKFMNQAFLVDVWDITRLSNIMKNILFTIAFIIPKPITINNKSNR